MLEQEEQHYGYAQYIKGPREGALLLCAPGVGPCGGVSMNGHWVVL